MRVVNAFTKGNQIILVREGGTTEYRPAERVAYFRQPVSGSTIISCVAEPNGWYRASFFPGYFDQASQRYVDYRDDYPDAFEADLSPVKRFMADHDIQVGKPRRCYLDIETDSDVSIKEAILGRAQVFCWAIVDGQSGETYAEINRDESLLLDALMARLTQYDQVVSWNGDAFDFPVLKAKLPHYNWRSKLLMDQMLCFKRSNIMTAETGEEKQSYALSHIARTLGVGDKLDVDSSKTRALFNSNPAKLLEYCKHDAKLQYLIEQETGYLDLHQQVCELCNIFPDSHSLKPTQIVDGYMLRIGRKHGVHFKSKPKNPVGAKFPGAFVMKPTRTGILTNVRSADFASMYPSIMVTYNLSPETKDPDGPIHSVTGVRTRAEPGLITNALRDLMALRNTYKARKKQTPPGSQEEKDLERATNALKTVTNSFYGVMGTPYSRFYDRDMVEATTQNGAHLIQATIDAAKKRDMIPVYGDTDSVLIYGTYEDNFNAFIDYCNTTLYPEITASHGCLTNLIKISNDKEFERIVFTAAKRYVAKRVGTDKPDIRGLEIKRGDSSRLARRLQQKIVDLFIQGKIDPKVYVNLVLAERELYLSGTLPVTDIAVSKTLAEHYDNPPAHARIANDAQPGERVAYVVLDASVSPMKVVNLNDYTGGADWYHVWESAYTPSMRLLAAMFPQHEWSRYGRVRPKHRPLTGQLSLL